MNNDVSYYIYAAAGWEVGMYLILSIALFSLFVGHVLAGSFAGMAPVGDIGEMIILILAAICFVVAILKAEKAEKSYHQKP